MESMRHLAWVLALQQPYRSLARLVNAPYEPLTVGLRFTSDGTLSSMMRRHRLPDSTLTPVYREDDRAVWQTGSVAASDLEYLLSEVPRCGTVVICAGYRPGWTWRTQWPEATIVPLIDALRGIGDDHRSLLDRAWRAVERGWQKGHDVVVACEIGAVRSAGVLLCWLTRARGLPFDAALALLQETRGAAIGRDYTEIFAPARCPPDGFFGHVLAVATGLDEPWRTDDEGPRTNDQGQRRSAR
jgi:hypothetical protein